MADRIDEDKIKGFALDFKKIEDEISKDIIGQKDIIHKIIISMIADGNVLLEGLPGTGKTLLLYDIAMKLSVRQRVCIIHCGEAGKEWKLLHERLRRTDFLADNQLRKQYSGG